MRRFARASQITVLGAFLAILAGEPVLAQAAVSGHVIDAETEAPIASAFIQLVAGQDASDVIASGYTNEEGRFRLETDETGTYRLHAESLGYEAATTPLFDLVRDARTLEVELRLSADAVLLAPLTVVSDRPARLTSMSGLRLEFVGYYRRKETWGTEGLGVGHFLDRDEIRHLNPSRISDVVRMIPGVKVAVAGGRDRVIRLRSVTTLSEGRCIPTVYIDGVPAANGANIDDILSPSDLTAVEVYAGITVPGRFMRGACGAIVLWTGG